MTFRLDLPLGADAFRGPGFDATGGTQQPAPGHDPTAPMGETSLSTTGKLVVGALVGGAAWYLYTYGWPSKAKPSSKGRKVRR